MAFIHGLLGSSSNAGGGVPPTAPQNFQFNHAQQGLLSTATKVTCSTPASAGTMPIQGYKYYRDGSLIATSSAGNSSDRTYVHTGLTTSATYSYTVTAFSAAGESPHSASISFKNPSPAMIGLTASNRWFGEGTRNASSNRPNVDGDGFIAVQIYASGNWWISTNPDSAPITVLMVGGGGGVYSPWNPKGGAGGGALFVLDEVTNLQDLGTGSSYPRSVVIGAGAAYNSSYSGGITQCSNLHYNGSSWDTIYCGGGQTGTANIQYGGSGTGADISMNASAGYHTTNKGTGHQVTSPTTYKGGDGGNSHASGGQNPSLAYQASGGGGGGGTPSGANGGAGYSYASGANGGSGGFGYHFDTTGADKKGWGGMHTNNGSLYFVQGVGGGGGGTAWGYSGYQPSYVPSLGYGYGGGAHGTAARYATYFAQLTTVFPNGQDMQGNWSSSSIYCSAQATTGGGAGGILNGTVQGGSGGSGSVYIRLHT